MYINDIMLFINIIDAVTSTTTAGNSIQAFNNMGNQYQQSLYNNNQQISGTSNYASAPAQTSYYTANQQTGNNYGQGYNWNQYG